MYICVNRHPQHVLAQYSLSNKNNTQNLLSQIQLTMIVFSLRTSWCRHYFILNQTRTYEGPGTSMSTFARV